ncbi:unnamed protein product, partial [Ectocarpus sp. 12 AP-2014]
ERVPAGQPEQSRTSSLQLQDRRILRRPTTDAGILSKSDLATVVVLATWLFSRTYLLRTGVPAAYNIEAGPARVRGRQTVAVHT